MLKHFHVTTLMGMGIEDFPSGLIAAGGLMQYLMDTQKTSLEHITHLYPYLTSKYMLLDSSTRRNLELTETLREKQKEVLYCGYWIKPRPLWGQEPCGSLWNSL